MEEVFAEANVLDVDLAISVVELSQLGRGLIISGLLIVGVSALTRLLREWRPRIRNGPTTAGTVSRVPWPSVQWGGFAVAVVGAALALVSGISSNEILRGSLLPPSALTVTAAGVIVFAGLLALWGKRHNSTPKTKRFTSLGAFVLALALATGVVLTPDLPRPARSAEAHASVTGSIQAVVSLIPGAEGGNTLRVGLSGDEAELAVLRDTLQNQGASATLTSLELGESLDTVILTIDERGRLVAQGVALPQPGRWRVSVNLGAPDAVATLDVTIQENPRYIP